MTPFRPAAAGDKVQHEVADVEAPGREPVQAQLAPDPGIAARRVLDGRRRRPARPGRKFVDVHGVRRQFEDELVPGGGVVGHASAQGGGRQLCLKFFRLLQL